MDRIARQRNEQLDRLPDDLGGRVKGLRDYEFVDDEARQKFEELMQELQKQMVDQMFQGMKGSHRSRCRARTCRECATWCAS